MKLVIEKGGIKGMEYKVMIVEDDFAIAKLLSSHIEKYGYETILVRDFDRILDIFLETNPHLTLIDINLPKYDGYYWCRKIRQISKIPIIIISARDSEMDQVMGIESGADDYITKPFYYDVVMAKIKSQLRRCYGILAPNVSEERKLDLEGLILYPERPELHFNNNSTILTKKEAILAEMLMGVSPMAVSRDTLMEKLWDDQAFIDENTLNVNVARLRKKLQGLGIEKALETVRGHGYRLNITWVKKL